MVIEVMKMTKISKNIKRLRMLQNMSQEELAQKLFVSRQAVSSWENNRTQPDLDMIQKRIRTLITGLANCGLDSSQTSNEDLRTILDNFLNGGMKTEFGTVVSQ